jgi:hypothetical protein
MDAIMNSQDADVGVSAGAAANCESGDVLSEPICILGLANLKRHAHEVIQKLQVPVARSSSADEDELHLWICVRRCIFDEDVLDPDGKSRCNTKKGWPFRELARKENEFNLRKDKVIKQKALLQRLFESFPPEEAQDDDSDLQQDKIRLQEFERKRDAALAELRLLRLSLYKSILASVVCTLGTATRQSSFFISQLAKFRVLPDPLKHMQVVVKEALALCWSTHGVNAKDQSTYESKWGGGSAEIGEEDAVTADPDLKLLRTASKWPTTWLRETFDIVKSVKPIKRTESKVVLETQQARELSSNLLPASGCVTLADVTAVPIEEPEDASDSRRSSVRLFVPVKILVNKLCKGTSVRICIKTADCIAGGEIAYFLKDDGDRKAKTEFVSRDDCVILVLKVNYRASTSLSLSIRRPDEMQITTLNDDDHTRWFVLVLS